MSRPMDTELKSQMCAQLEKMAVAVERMRNQVQRGTGKITHENDVWDALDVLLDEVRQAARVAGRA